MTRLLCRLPPAEDGGFKWVYLEARLSSGQRTSQALYQEEKSLWRPVAQARPPRRAEAPAGAPSELALLLQGGPWGNQHCG